MHRKRDSQSIVLYFCISLYFLIPAHNKQRLVKVERRREKLLMKKALDAPLSLTLYYQYLTILPHS